MESRSKKLRGHLDAREAAAELGVSRSMVSRLFRDRKLSGVSVSGKIYLRQDSVAALKKARNNAPPKRGPKPQKSVEEPKRTAKQMSSGAVVTDDISVIEMLIKASKSGLCEIISVSADINAPVDEVVAAGGLIEWLKSACSASQFPEPKAPKRVDQDSLF